MNDTTDEDFQARLSLRAIETENLLERLLDQRPQTGEIVRPSRLVAAMRHGALNGGKRLRPFLLLESAALFAGNPHAAGRVAAALECIHCYSLIHDDLPAMDDDDIRRGQPTVHRAFDEATAILAGDSLLTYAFDTIADEETNIPAQARLALITSLSRAAGFGGMAGGQMLDLEAANTPPDEEGIITLQAMKTGALIRFACEAGPLIGGAPQADRERLSEFGAAVGLAFQLADDLLDLTASPDAMGKATRKDEAAGKATLVKMHGAQWARRQLDGLVAQAAELLAPYGPNAAMLVSAARFVAARER